MKKLISIALAAALVLMLAAPALAITGSTAVDATTVAKAPFDESKYGFTFLTFFPDSPLSLLNASQVAANKLYIQYETLFWRLNLVTQYGDTTMHADDYNTPAVRISSDIASLSPIVKGYKLSGMTVESIPVSPALGGGSASITFPVPRTELGYDIPDGTNYVFVGSAAVMKNVNGYMKAEVLGCETSAKFDAFAGIPFDFPGTNADNMVYTVSGEPLYEFSYTTDTTGAPAGTTGVFTVRCLEASAATDGTAIAFYINGTTGNNVAGISVDGDMVQYVIPVSGGGVPVEKIGGLLATDPANANSLKAYREVMNFFGFNYNAEGTLKGGHFATRLSAYYWNAVKPVNIYTAQVTVPGTVTPPKTGDNASLTGIAFAALAVAMAVALMCVNKKVRE